MAYEGFGRKISKVAVIGSGQIGPDIALHFSRTLGRYGVSVVIRDILGSAIEQGFARVKSKLKKGVESGVFKKEEADAILSNITFTTEKIHLRGVDLVIEAATENIGVKQAIFSELEEFLPSDAIFASNSSHIEPEIIFENLKNPGRALVIHYFFPAERNMLVEIVPANFTDPEILDFCMKFYETIGKVPIKVGSRYGYAIDPIFEGLFQAAALCVEEGLGSTKLVDGIAQKALGLGVGPFTAMNLTGGNPITQHGLRQMNEKLSRWFRSPSILDNQIKLGKPWDALAKGEKLDYDEKTYKEVSERMLGAYFGLTCFILDSGITNISDLEMALELGLVINPPFEMMNRLGVKNAFELVQKYAKIYPEFPIAKSLARQAESAKPWKIPYLLRKELDDILILTIRRPKVLNALSRELFTQLREEFEKVKTRDDIKGVLLTGFGTRAFVSGADIGMIASLSSPYEGEALSRESQDALLAIEQLGKPVVCALNGLALGGGNELAMACTARVAKKGLKVLAGQPEVKLGIIPGAGATQRLPRIIGFEKAWELLRTGATLSSAQAKEIGLIEKEVEGDLIEEGLALLKDIISGAFKSRSIPTGPIEIPRKLPEVDIGSLSRRIDQILQEAIIEGAKLPLLEGLKLESKLFGECLKTKDMRIGIENFIKTGLKEPAKFIHE
jgi:enoyl-CoA hydratase/3-hydroxyacyl-CoA dehydrogenase